MKFAVKSVAVAAVSLSAVVGMSACSSSTTTDNLPNVTASPEGTVKVGDTEVTSGLPSGWPSDVPTPQGLTLKGGGGTPQGMSASWSGPGTAAAVQAQLDTDFKNAGFTSKNSFGGGSVGGVTSWTKGAMTVQVVIANDGANVAVNETVLTGAN